MSPPPTIAKSLALIGFSTLSVLAVAPAQAVVIDFESLAHNDNGVSFPGTPYTEDGFTMTSSLNDLGAYTVWGTELVYYPGSTALGHNPDAPSMTTTLTQVGGGAFSLSSIDLADIYNNGTNVNVDFIGNLVGGGTVTQSFTTDSVAGLETFTFNSSFTNLASVQWTPTIGVQYIQFDNININGGGSTAVPEPFTVLGTLIGAGSSVALKRRLAKQDKQDIG